MTNTSPQPKRPYYTLLLKEASFPWGPQFGDYLRAVVQEERQTNRDHGIPASDMLIIKTGDTQAEIDAEIERINKSAST